MSGGGRIGVLGPAARVRARRWIPRSVVATLQVELVAVERKIWSGEATMVIARTTEGELGVLPGHAPLLGQLAEGGVVTIRTGSGDGDVIVAAHGGFLSVTERGVSILAETAEISTEIDVERAREA